MLRVEGMRGIRPLRLEPPLDPVPVGEGAQLRAVLLAHGIEVAQDEDGDRLAHGQLHLRHALAKCERREHLAQRHDERRDRRWQHLAGAHVRHEARLALVEAHQHAALLRDVVHADARPLAVAPRGPVDGRQDRLRRDLADAREVVFQHALLGRYLRGRVDVLHGASAAGAEVRATRPHALARFHQHLGHGAQVEVAAAAAPRESHPLAGDAALDEGDLAVHVGDADALVVDRFDGGDPRGGLARGLSHRLRIASRECRTPASRSPCSRSRRPRCR